MKNSNLILFIIPTLIWGSTWYAIKFQLGAVHPMLSVAYRFALAGMLLLVTLWLLGFKLRFTIKEHFFMFLQGACLFGFNYWLVYTAEISLTSGLVAVIFSLLIFFNVVLNALVLKGAIKRVVLIGGTLGVMGTFLIFYNEIISIGLSSDIIKAIGLCFLSLLLASTGNILSAFNQRNKIPVLQNNAYGMTYGAAIMLILSFALQIEITFDFSTPYIISLLYLSLFGSIIAFTSYLRLLGKIGPDRGAYVILITPVIALIISSIYEGFALHFITIIGIVMLLIGNMLAMNVKLNLISKFKKRFADLRN